MMGMKMFLIALSTEDYNELPLLGSSGSIPLRTLPLNPK
jgi:hypothetical protein